MHHILTKYEPPVPKIVKGFHLDPILLQRCIAKPFENIQKPKHSLRLHGVEAHETHNCAKMV